MRRLDFLKGMEIKIDPHVYSILLLKTLSVKAFPINFANEKRSRIQS